MPQPAQDDQHLGAAEKSTYPTAHEAQRDRARAGKYQCQVCNTRFSFDSDEPIACPKCKNTVADSLVPFYIEDDPATDEMLSRDEFSAGD